MSKLWNYNKLGECEASDSGSLPQPLVHMLANCPQYFSICDNYLRGFSGFDYTRMFGEFDGQFFPKENGRFLWLRLEMATLGLPITICLLITKTSILSPWGWAMLRSNLITPGMVLA